MCKLLPDRLRLKARIDGNFQELSIYIGVIQMDQSANETRKGKRGDNAKTMPRLPNGKFISKEGALKGYKKYQPKKLLDQMTLDEALARLKAGNANKSTIAGKQFFIIQELLGIDAKTTVIELLRHDIATCATLCRAIVDYCQDSKGKLVSKNGELPEVLNKLPKLQASMVRSVDLLMKLEGKEKPATLQEKQKIADIILNLPQNEDDPEGE